MLNPMAFIPSDTDLTAKKAGCACGWLQGAGTGSCGCGWISGNGLPMPEQEVSQ